MSNRKILQDVVCIRLVLILLLVLYHSFAMYCDSWAMPEGIHEVKAYWWIGAFSYSFLLETFVFISGYVFGYQVREKFSGCIDLYNTVISKARRLLIPSVLFSSIYILCFNLGDAISPIKQVYNVINGEGHMWYLPMLFWCFVVIFIVEKLRIPSRYIILLASFASVFSLLTLPLRLSSTAYYFIFFYIGYLIQRNDIYSNSKIKLKTAFILLVLFLLVFVLSKIILTDKSFLSFAEQSMMNKLIISLATRVSTLLLSALGLASIYSFVNLMLNRGCIIVNKSMIRLSGYCFGVYIFQQFILKYFMYNASVINIFGSYWLPWVAFVIALLVSIILTSAILKIYVGRFLVG